ncbi:penicillin-binding protein 2 [Craurococcus roseus]|uniref:Penicillin-binding protein 2 n=1 Tax=Craurococcus roseus TaxID=77585 RepID=A0ABN1FXL3_9PROT
MSHDPRLDELHPPPPPPGSASRALTTTTARRAAPELARRGQIEKTRGRLVVAACGFAALFGAVGLKLGLATVIDPVTPKLRAAPRVPTGETSAVVARASITDRNGEVLALSLPVTEFYANPMEINDPVEAAEKLLAVLPDLDRERLVERITQRTVPGTERPVQFAYIARNLTPRQRQAVNDLGIPGFHFRDAERRFHPQGSAAAHLLGTVDVDGRGIAGVERSFDEKLRNGREPLRLSIDVRVQVALREAVGKAIADFTGIGGAGVVMDIHTGEVLAMVSLPDFDISDPTSLIRKPPKPGQAARPDQDPVFNRATVGLYEPGSTFKLFTAAMALDSGVVNIWNGFDASKPIRYGRFQIDDFKGKNRWLAVPEIVAFSSNIGTAHMAVASGVQRHREYMGRFGMLQRSGLELPEVARPLAPSAQSWREINTMTIGFGHGISVTPLHVVTGVAALANGGVLRQPTIVAQPPGAEREGTRVISERTSETMRKLMRLVVTDGSGKGAEVPGYFVGGKTGTAQKTGPRGGYLEDKRIAAFVGAFPLNAPRYAIYVMVDEPRPNAKSHGYATAGWVAAPAAGAVIRRVAPILGMVPEQERIPQIQQAISIPLQPPKPPRAPATPAAPTKPPRSMPVPTAMPAPPELRRTEVAGPRLFAAAPPEAASAPR